MEVNVYSQEQVRDATAISELFEAAPSAKRKSFGIVMEALLLGAEIAEAAKATAKGDT